MAVARPVIDALEGLGVQYRIGGSVASSAYGIARATLDIDLVADLRAEHVVPLVAEIQADYYVDEFAVLDAVQRRASFNVIHLDTASKIDVFIAGARPYDQEAFQRTRCERLAGEGQPEFNLVSPEDLILNKLDWYRQGGGVSERQWRDVIGVLKVQAGALDREYLRRWAAELGLTDLLDRVIAEAEPPPTAA